MIQKENWTEEENERLMDTIGFLNDYNFSSLLLKYLENTKKSILHIKGLNGQK